MKTDFLKFLKMEKDLKNVSVRGLDSHYKLLSLWKQSQLCSLKKSLKIQSFMHLALDKNG